MIQQSELRLGNWLRNFLGEEFQVVMIPISPMFPAPEPIPLTEEWLVDKFEFNKERLKDAEGHQFYSLDVDGFSIVEKDGVFAFLDIRVAENARGYDYDKTILSFVHHLQNLYSALKHKELTLSVPEQQNL